MLNHTHDDSQADLDILLSVLPPRIREALEGRGTGQLLEIVLDLGRVAEARYPGGAADLGEAPISGGDLAYVVERIGAFGDDNRAGIGRTLHRISAIRNRRGEVVGLTCRVGRAVRGTVALLRDVIEEGKSILILGRPGVGKTTLLREAARVLADELGKRVVVVDTSNEIAGDGDVPHPGIGRARRMQVARPAEQHRVMIEAVENHMPEVIVIDEIGTELEAQAARTIAERGVQLIGTAHGRTLENLLVNPTLADLVGGIQSVTLGDEEAKRRGTQKTVLERKAPPTFDVLIEQEERHRMGVHLNVAAAVDAMLRDDPLMREMREREPDGSIHRWKDAVEPVERPEPAFAPWRESPRPREDRSSRGGEQRFPREDRPDRLPRRPRSALAGQPTTQTPWWQERQSRPANGEPTSARPKDEADDTGGWLDPDLAQSMPLLIQQREATAAQTPHHPTPGESQIRRRRIFPLGVNRSRLEAAIRELGVPAEVVSDEHDADIIFVLRSMHRKYPDRIEAAEASGRAVELRSDSLDRLREALVGLLAIGRPTLDE